MFINHFKIQRLCKIHLQMSLFRNLIVITRIRCQSFLVDIAFRQFVFSAITSKPYCSDDDDLLRGDPLNVDY